ncbi:MAG TPA: hypothetical protein PLP33_14765 [Leptospiraceae bacterium]|nr:hypothetical protein [Leptospiraceae bacterium]
MKIFLLLSFILLFTVVGYSQEVVPSPTPKPVSAAEEVKSAKQVLSEVVDRSANGEKKTFSDVLDKGIDLFASYATTVGEMIKKIAPEVWRIMIKQQYAKGITGIAYWILVPLVPLSLVFGIRRFMHGKNSGKSFLKLEKGYESEESSQLEELRVTISWILLLIFFLTSLFSIYNITEYGQMLINPEYYAIKDMLEMVK